MINWLTRWFSKRTPATPATAPDTALIAPAAPHPAAAQAEAESEADVAAPEPIDLPLLFFRSLSTSPVATAPAATGQLIIDELARLVEAPQHGADLVPRVPAVIPQLLKSLREEGMSGAELSRQLAQDVVLVAEVIREANSPFYSPPTPVRSIEGAVMLLGQNGMRMLLARVAFRPVISMQAGRFANQGAPLVWRESEACALAASLLAPAAGANVFEAYLAGLLHNVGLIVALRLADQIYTGAALPASSDFAHPLLQQARRLSASIASLWEFPPAVADAIVDAVSAMPATPLAQVLAGAERLAMLRVLADSGQLDLAAPCVPESEQTVFEQLKLLA